MCTKAIMWARNCGAATLAARLAWTRGLPDITPDLEIWNNPPSLYCGTRASPAGSSPRNLDPLPAVCPMTRRVLARVMAT